MHSNIPAAEFTAEFTAETIREKIIEFRDGLPGFPRNHAFVMAQRAEEKPFVWMHSVTEPLLAFALVDAYAWAKDFTLEVDDADLEELGSLDPMDYAVYFILRINRDDDKTTLEAKPNAPLLVNIRNRQAKQIISLTAAPRSPEALCVRH
jgi:flagellar assembly factor FliW